MKKALAPYITDLLTENDCVIIPGFGGLIANSQPSVYNDKTHRFSPPGKSLGFNRKLMRNDGLLAQHIAASENMSYEKVVTLLESKIKLWDNALVQGKKVNLKDIGLFWLNQDKKVTFKPAETKNFLASSFGLESVSFPPVHHENINEKVERKVKERKLYSTKHRTGKSSMDWEIAAAIPLFIALGAFLAWTLSNYGIIGGDGNFAKLDPIVKEKTVSESQPEKKDEEIQTEVVTPVEETAPEMNEVVETESPPESIRDIPEKEKPVAEIVEKLRYHVIGGCFSIKKNATRMVRKMKADGYQASVVGQNGRGLYRVSYESFASRKAALAKLDSIRSASKSVWLLTH